MSKLTELRALIDKTNKNNAKVAPINTGGDGRMTTEAANTAAIARGHGQQKAIPKDIGHMPLRELVKSKK